MRKLILKVIKRIPSNFLRVFFYKKFLGYKIGKNVEIGKSIINCKKVKIGDNVIIRSNNNINCNVLNIGNNTHFHGGNVILGSANFSIGDNSRIINDHFIDLYNDVSIGNDTWLAGKASQIWTHGSIHTKTGKDLSIQIGDDIYIGSKVCISPGTKIASNNLVGMGSVISGVFLESNTIITGNFAKVVKQNINWKENW